MHDILQFLKSIADLFCEVVGMINSFQRYVDTLSSLKEKSMYVHGIQCDTCKNIHNDDRVSMSNLPSGWVALARDNEDTLHFCSVSHLYQWSLNTLNQPNLGEGEKVK